MSRGKREKGREETPAIPVEGKKEKGSREQREKQLAIVVRPTLLCINSTGMI